MIRGLDGVSWSRTARAGGTDVGWSCVNVNAQRLVLLRGAFNEGDHRNDSV